MASTILTNILSYEYEPDITTDNGRDGITKFEFSVVGGFSSLNSAFDLDQVISGVPDQPQGNFRVVRRNLSHVAGDTNIGLYRLQVACEGGTGNSSLYILETSYQYNKEVISGQFFSQAGGATEIKYTLEWLSPNATITTNSQSESISDAQGLAERTVREMPVQVIRKKPAVGPNGFPVIGQDIDTNKIIITGSSIEKAGGLYRVRATASKGQVEETTYS